MTFTLSPTTKWEVPMLLTPGNRYKIVIEAKKDKMIVAEGKLFHRAGK